MNSGAWNFGASQKDLLWDGNALTYTHEEMMLVKRETSVFDVNDTLNLTQVCEEGNHLMTTKYSSLST